VTLGEITALIASTWTGMSPVEAVAAVFGVVYVVLVIGQYRACWLAGLASTALYLYVFYRSGLFMQAGLQAYYVGVSLYGWRAWRPTTAGRTLPVTRASLRLQLTGIGLVIAATALSSAGLAQQSGAQAPLLDSLTTWSSVFATWLVARKKIDNWPWWLVTDVLIAVLCWRQGLYASMILYVLYLGLIVIGWRSWQADLQRSQPGSAERA
jgi:nicotinamide mononucleotide transporter